MKNQNNLKNIKQNTNYNIFIGISQKKHFSGTKNLPLNFFFQGKQMCTRDFRSAGIDFLVFVVEFFKGGDFFSLHFVTYKHKT